MPVFLSKNHISLNGAICFKCLFHWRLPHSAVGIVKGPGALVFFKLFVVHWITVGGPVPIGVVYMLHMCTDNQFSTLQSHPTRIKESIGLQKLYCCISYMSNMLHFPPLPLFLHHLSIHLSVSLSKWAMMIHKALSTFLHAVLKYILFMVPGGDFLYYI